jgi:hypothetical protein
MAWPIGLAAAGPSDAAALELFEKEVRPLLSAKCHSCHGGKKVRGGLALVDRDHLLAGGDTGPAVVPGRPEQSLLIKAIEQQGELKMPPKDRLPAADVARLRRWVALGAPWPRAASVATAPSDGSFTATEEQRRWWAFQPVRSPAPPEVKDRDWPQSEIDRFLLAELEARRIPPARPADRRTLLRRATFDLTGLPPTPEEIDAFLADTAPGAFARVVDRLLASQSYGERWGRHWLDVARYTDYYQANPHEHGEAPLWELFEAYRYRDWVVSAFNRDMPFDQFILHQFAGDLLPSPKGDAIYAEGVIATGFLVLGAWDPHDADKEKIVSDIADDQIDTVGKAFLGLTLGCARCHHHKFDPVSQEDYYGLAGIFYSTHILKALGIKGGAIVLQRLPFASPHYLRRREQQLAELARLEAQGRLLAARSAASLAVPQPELDRITQLGPLKGLVTTQERQDKARKELLPAPPLALGVQEGGTPGGPFPGVQDVPLHVRGSYAHLGPLVPRHLPHFFAGDRQAAIHEGSGRLELARWVASRDNPLTARVIVNRTWQHHFGEGIVRTPNNFGRLGEPPSHPALLDWLAAGFMEDGWSLKKLHRRIMLSTAYQQSGMVVSEVRERDPDNRWFGRMSPRRLEAEAIRDAMLVATGRLDRTLGGPAGPDLDMPRRSLYVQTTRWDRRNFSTLFDAASPEASVEKRGTSTVAPQALFLLNDAFVQAQARRLAARLRVVHGSDEDRIQGAYLWLYGRPAQDAEVRIGKAYLESAARRGLEAAWADYAHLLLCTDELVYLD